MPRSLPVRRDVPTLAWTALLVIAVATYSLGLGGQYIPSIGDELVYAHIARLTAASQQWLPLVSELEHMRNTKPPLLFWQAMWVTDWGHHWSLLALRTPSLIYTLLTTGALAWSAWLIAGNRRSACLAACVYLAFFCTFRLGRPYLTSAPETFWLSMPMFWLLWLRGRQIKLDVAMAAPSAALSWLAHVGFGIALGLGLAYKSFALIAPAATALFCAQWLSAPRVGCRTGWQVGLRVGLSSALALAMFALWFVLDPDPRAVWQEFVVGENAGKIASEQGYWQRALFGGGASLWAQLLAYVQNAGLLAFVVLGLAGLGIRQGWRLRQDMRALPVHWVILLCWLAVWLVVFSLPSQRSARYVVPAMPALAIVIALVWQQIGRIWFLMSALLCAVLLAAIGRIACAAQGLGIGTDLELGATLASALLGLLLVLCAFVKPAWTRACTVGACFAVYACLSLSTTPLNGAAGQYSADVVAQLKQARVAVPNNFNGQFERFEFLLPGNRFIAYDVEERASSRRSSAGAELQRLLAEHDAVIWLQADPTELAPPCAPACHVLGWRWEVKGRHQSGEIHLGNLWQPQQWLFRREWLIVAGAGVTSGARA